MNSRCGAAPQEMRVKCYISRPLTPGNSATAVTRDGSRAAPTLPTQAQSMDASRPTSAAEWQSPMSP